MNTRSSSTKGRSLGLGESSHTGSKKVHESTRPLPEDPNANTSKKPLEYKHPELSFLAEYLIYPFYDFLAQFLPRWVKPNHITLFGIACTVLGSFICFSCFIAETSHFERPFSLNPSLEFQHRSILIVRMEFWVLRSAAYLERARQPAL